MKTVTFQTKPPGARGWAHMLGLLVLATGAWALGTGSAQARGHGDVYWSIGVDSPGVSVDVSNAPPPRPVVVHQPAPVVVHQPYPYVQPVVVHQPYPYQPYPYVRPVIVQPRPVVVYPGWGPGPRWDDRHERRHWRHHHRHHDHHRGRD